MDDPILHVIGSLYAVLFIIMVSIIFIHSLCRLGLLSDLGPGIIITSVQMVDLWPRMSHYIDVRNDGTKHRVLLLWEDNGIGLHP